MFNIIFVNKASMQTNNIQNHSLRIIATFLENEKSKDELSNYEEYFIKCIIKIHDIVTNITIRQFKQTLIRKSELKNSAIDSPLLSKL